MTEKNPRYQWTEEARTEYTELFNSILNLFQPDSETVVSQATQQSQAKPYFNIDELTDISYEILSKYTLIGTFPKNEIKVEFFKDQEKLNIRYIESDDPVLEDLLALNYADAEYLSIFIAFDSNDRPALFTLIYKANCTIIHIKDNSADQILHQLLTDDKILIFPQAYNYTRNKGFIKRDFKTNLNLIISRLQQYFSGQKFEPYITDIFNDYSIFKGIGPNMLERYSYLMIIVSNHFKLERPQAIKTNKHELNDTFVPLLISMAYETYCHSLFIDKMEKLEKIQNPEFIPYQKLVDAQMLFEGFWPLNKTIKVEFAQSEFYDVTLQTAVPEWYEDWCDKNKYYCIHAYQSPSSYFLAIGDFEAKKILVLQGKKSEIKKDIGEYINDPDLKFVFHFGKIIPVIRKLGVSDGYIIDKNIFDRLDKLDTQFYLIWQLTNDSFTHVLHMAYTVYEMMKVFSEQKETQKIEKEQIQFLKLKT